MLSYFVLALYATAFIHAGESGVVMPSSSCPGQLSMCKANPCEVEKCISFPMADCIPDYCGGCKANFFFNGLPLDDMTCSSIII